MTQDQKKPLAVGFMFNIGVTQQQIRDFLAGCPHSEQHEVGVSFGFETRYFTLQELLFLLGFTVPEGVAPKVPGQ